MEDQLWKEGERGREGEGDGEVGESGGGEGDEEAGGGKLEKVEVEMVASRSTDDLNMCPCH